MHTLFVVACEFKVYQKKKKSIKIIFEKHNSQIEKEKIIINIDFN